MFVKVRESNLAIDGAKNFGRFEAFLPARRAVGAGPRSVPGANRVPPSRGRGVFPDAARRRLEPGRGNGRPEFSLAAEPGARPFRRRRTSPPWLATGVAAASLP